MIITLNELRELEASTKKQRITDAIYFVLRQILEFDAEIRTNECEDLFLFEVVDSFLKKKLFVFLENDQTVSICDNMEEPSFVFSTNFSLEDSSELLKLKNFLINNIKKHTFKIFDYNILA